MVTIRQKKNADLAERVDEYERMNQAIKENIAQMRIGIALAKQFPPISDRTLILQSNVIEKQLELARIAPVTSDLPIRLAPQDSGGGGGGVHVPESGPERIAQAVSEGVRRGLTGGPTAISPLAGGDGSGGLGIPGGEQHAVLDELKQIRKSLERQPSFGSTPGRGIFYRSSGL